MLLSHLQTELSSNFRFSDVTTNEFAVWKSTMNRRHHYVETINTLKNTANTRKVKHWLLLPNIYRYECTSFTSDKSLENNWKSRKKTMRQSQHDANICNIMQPLKERRSTLYLVFTYCHYYLVLSHHLKFYLPSGKHSHSELEAMAQSK